MPVIIIHEYLEEKAQNLGCQNFRSVSNSFIARPLPLRSHGWVGVSHARSGPGSAEVAETGRPPLLG